MFRAGSGETGASVFTFTNLRRQLAAAAKGNVQNASPGYSSCGRPCRIHF
jgi:hypothetical protein